MPSAKKKLQDIVKRYVRAYRKEYEIVQKAVAMRRHMINDGLNFEEGSDLRPLYEMSETLERMIVLELNVEELTWMKTKVGGRWFAREFPAFALQVKQ